MMLARSSLTTLVLCVLGCEPANDPSKLPKGSACSAENVVACEDALARAVALGDDVVELSRAYAAARRERDGGDAFAQAATNLAELGKTGRAALLLLGGAKSPLPGGELPSAESGPIAALGKAPSELVWVALAEAAGLDYLAVVRADGSVVRAFGRDPLKPWMIGLVPAVVDADASVLRGDAAIERELRATFEAASRFDYVAATDHVDVLEGLVGAEPPGDAQALRARVMTNALGLPKQRPLVSGAESTEPAPGPEPRASDSGYYHLLRVRTDPASAGAFAKRSQALLPSVPEDLRGLAEQTWGTPSEGCTVTLPHSFERPRDLAFAHLLAPALLPARARDERGRLRLDDWYPRYGKLVDLVERTQTGFFLVPTLIYERGGKSSIVPSGSDVHRRVNVLLSKHAKALLALSTKKPGRVGLGQLGFLASPGAYGDAETIATLKDLSRVSAQGSLALSSEPWDVLAATFMGAILSANMPPDMRDQHLNGLLSAFSERLSKDFQKRAGWPVALSFGADLAYRAVFKQGPDVAASVANITRALETDPNIEGPGLAALLSAFVRYGGLASLGGLGSPVLEDDKAPLPGRAAARSAIESALGRLSTAPAEPKLSKQVAALSDNAGATLALAVGSLLDEAPAAPPKAKGEAPQCEAELGQKPDPKLERALRKLADQRKTLWQNAALQSGKDEWTRRARGLVLVLSDAIDLAQAEQAKRRAPKDKRAQDLGVKFFISQAQADQVLADALSSFGASDNLVKASVNGYALGRGFLSGGPTYFRGDGLERARELLAAAGRLLAEDGGPTSAGALLTSIAPALGRSGPDVTPPFLSVAGRLFGENKRQEAEMVLLAAVITSAMSEQALGKGPFELAEKHQSQLGWVLEFVRQVGPRAGALGEPKFQPGLDALLKERCAVASSSTVSGVLGAIERFRTGERETSRLELDKLLEADKAGLTIPHVSYAFKHETKTRAFNVSIALDLGAPFVGATGDFNVGGGFQTAGEPKFSLEVAVDSPDSKRASDASAQYYVHATAVAGVLHFLAKDPVRGERAAARVLGSVLTPTSLYKPGLTDEPARFAEPAKPTLALLAQLAIDSGRPLLGGALLQIVRSGFDPRTVKADELTALLDPLPRPLVGISELEPVLARTKKTLGALGFGLPCVGPKTDKAVFLRPTCEAYPQALALRVADAVLGLPELSAGKKSDGCGDLAALDGFLRPAQRGKYEPEKLLDAAEKLIAEKKVLDATLLLTRQRDPSHCVPRALAAMRKAHAELAGAPAQRADLLTGLINCGIGGEAAALSLDLAALDAEVRKLGDPSREIQGGLFAAALSVRRGEPQLLDTLTKQPDFVTRHKEHGGLLPFAMLLDHLSRALSEKPIEPESLRKELDLVCGINDAPAGPDLCKMLKQLRQSGLSAQDRKKLAEQVIAKLSPK